MSFDAVAALFRESMALLGVVAAPLLAALFLVGLVVGVLQSATQVQEPAVGALPRILTAGAVAALLGPWMVERLARFFASAVERLAERPF